MKSPPPCLTDRQVGRQETVRLSDVTSDRIGLAADDKLQKQGGRKWKKERNRERKEPAHPSQLPLHQPSKLRGAAGPEKTEGRKGSDDCLLFEPCVLRSHSQRTLIQAWLFISSPYPCRRRQAAVVLMVAMHTLTGHSSEVPACCVCVCVCLF